MPSPVDNSNVDHDGHKDVFEYEKLDPAEFHANVFILGDEQLQQKRLNCNFKHNPLELKQLRRIDQIIEGECDEKKKEQLGKNLLDSFALIFAQSESNGVTATAMELSGREPDTFILHVARNCGEDGSLSDLAEHIERWFTTRDPNVDNPVPVTDSLWSKILQNCYLSIKKEKYEKCFSKIQNISNKDDYHFRYVRELVYRVASDLNMPPEAKGLLSVLDVMYYLSDYNIDMNNGRLVRSTDPEDPRVPGRIDLYYIHKLTSLCYELLASYKEPMETLFKSCEMRVRRGSIGGLEIVSNHTSLEGVRRLIYVVAQYRRAWYDMVRFKIDHSSATLRIAIVPRDDPALMNLRMIANAGERNNVLSKERKKDFFKKHRTSLQCRSNYPYTLKMEPRERPGFTGVLLRLMHIQDDRASFCVHCEMQILEVLLTRDISKLYNYIGSSKGPCWLCYHALVSMAPGFKMRQPHLKLYPAWLPPKFEESTENRLRFSKVLKTLNSEMLRLIRSGNINGFESRYTISDCPDIEQRFQSPKTEKMHKLIGGKQIVDEVVQNTSESGPYKICLNEGFWMLDRKVYIALWYPDQ